ncbi:MAG: SHOCT domain-containing protein [Burkholderiaceae bacterium]|nr:SHOCT domain-containing protein [Burkholderiaceae bacterium]
MRPVPTRSTAALSRGRRAALVAFVALVATGCATEDIVRPRLDVTVGQQLIDLKQAHDAGALSRAEYDRQRTQLIDSVR